MFFWILGIIAVFALALCYGVAATQKARLVDAEAALRDALWQRHNRIPLLLSILAPLDATQKATFAHIIELRATLSDEHIALADRVAHEKRMSHLLRDVLIAAEDDDTIAKNAPFIALKHEFDELHDACNKAINEYNYQLDKYRAMDRLPWFAVWGAGGHNRPKSPLQAV